MTILFTNLNRSLVFNRYAYDTGNPNIIPSSMIIERQNVIIEELKGKLPLELDKLEKMSPEELRKQIDKAIRDVSICFEPF